MCMGLRLSTFIIIPCSVPRLSQHIFKNNFIKNPDTGGTIGISVSSKYHITQIFFEIQQKDWML